MPLVTTRPLEAPPPPTLFVKLLGGTGYEIGNDMHMTNSAIYATGRTSSEVATQSIFVVKYDLSGNVQWQRKLESTGNDNGLGITTDSNGDVYVTGSSNGSGTTDIITAKYNPAGVLQWQRLLGGTGNEAPLGIAANGTDVVVSGYTNTEGEGSNDAFLCKYNSSGVLQWQKAFGTTSGDNFGGHVAFDGSDNIYAAGGYFFDNKTRMLLTKHNSSGVLQWAKQISATSPSNSGPTYGYNIVFDSNGDMCIAGTTRAPAESNYYHLVMKVDTDGVIQWVRKFGHNAHNNDNGKIAVDNNDNIYLIAADLKNGESSHKVYFAKFNNSGILQFQRLFGAQLADAGLGGAVDSSGNIFSYGYTANYIQSNNEAMLCKFPADGSGTGNLATGWYNDYIYEDAASSHNVNVDASSILSNTSATLTELTTTLTDTVGTLTDGATTYTETTLV